METSPQHDPILAPLNDAQRAAVRHVDGPLLILAGAGSGKTRVLTHRIAYLMAQGIPGRSILAVTFTNKAAREMESRVRNLLDEAARGRTDGSLPTLGTFHSVCARILRHEIQHLGRERSFAIYDTSDQKAALKRAMAKVGLDPAQHPPAAVLGGISEAKSELVGPTEYAERATGDILGSVVARVYPEYEAILKEENALDFDDLLGMTVRIFQQHPTVLAAYQERWPYILVDEYQDTNHVQYTLVKLLAAKTRNLAVVGDDWQGIYSWRGADLRNILDFQKDYPDAVEVKLEENYRSTPTILDAAQAVIQKVKERTDKTLRASREDGDPIHVYEARDERHEGELICDVIEEESLSLSDTAILYRTNAQSRVLEESMLRAGIPYQIVGGTKFYDRKEVKDILAYLQLLVNADAATPLLRIINVPPRKIGEATIGRLQALATSQNVPLARVIQFAAGHDGLPPATSNALASFITLIGTLRHIASQKVASEVIAEVVKRSNYDRFLKDGTDEGEERYANVLELLSVAKKYDSLPAGESLQSFLEEVALVSDVDSMREGEAAVTLMTLHTAKGLEYQNVFLVGMEEGIFPHNRSLQDAAQAEEERRLCYVGMTRAMDRLFCLYARQRQLYGTTQVNPPSRFLSDLPGEKTQLHSSRRGHFALEASSGSYTLPSISRGPAPAVTTGTPSAAAAAYAVGDCVIHPAFGRGVVSDIRGDLLTIAFQTGGTKKLVATIAPLTKTSVDPEDDVQVHPED